MMEIFNFLDIDTANYCKADATGNILFIFQIARLVIRILQIAVPFALIIWGSLDFFKAVIAGDEKDIKAKKKPFTQRLVAAIVILLLPTIVNIIIGAVAKNNTSINSSTGKKEGFNFAACWDAAGDTSKIVIPSGDNFN